MPLFKFPEEGQKRVKRGKTSKQAIAIVANCRTVAGLAETFKRCRQQGVAIATAVVRPPSLRVFVAVFFPIYYSFLGLLWGFLRDSLGGV